MKPRHFNNLGLMKPAQKMGRIIQHVNKISQKWLIFHNFEKKITVAFVVGEILCQDNNFTVTACDSLRHFYIKLQGEFGFADQEIHLNAYMLLTEKLITKFCGDCQENRN